MAHAEVSTPESKEDLNTSSNKSDESTNGGNKLKMKKKFNRRKPASFKSPNIDSQSKRNKGASANSEQGTPDVPISTDKAPSEGANSYGLTGDWGGRCTNLSELGLDFALVLKGGIATTQTNVVGTNTSSGLVFKGLLPKREDDRFGIAFTRVTPGPEYVELNRAAGIEISASELNIEVNYRAELMTGVALQPDFQFIQNPSFSRELQNARVGSLRLELSF